MGNGQSGRAVIAREQANKPERRVLVVVDEINALLDAAGVYGAFLAPLEQGIYVRRGRVFSLKPWVWIFAGTDSEASKQPKSEKVSDFEERLTATVKLDYKSLKDRAKDDRSKEDVRLKAKLEQAARSQTAAAVADVGRWTSRAARPAPGRD